MVRYMTPYFLVGLLFAGGGGAAYGAGAIGVAAGYGLIIAGALIAGVGYARWDERQHPRRPE
jgi:hypothetical protein